MNTTRPLAFLGLALALLAPTAPGAQGPLPAGQDDYEALRRRAEAHVAERSYTLAKRLYEEAARLDLDADQERWVGFRLADTTWRAQAASEQSDDTESARAEARLRELVAARDRPEDQDRVWAEAHESLGAYSWSRPRGRNWGGGWPHFQRALEWWAASSDIETARRRYLDIVFEVALPTWDEYQWNRGVYAGSVPRQVLENAVEIAVDEADVARAHFLLGMHYVQSGQNLSYRGRAERELGAVLELGKRSEWYDDALYRLGDRLQNVGRPSRNEHGGWTWKRDYKGALALFRRLLREFEKGETAWYDSAASHVRNITARSTTVDVGNFFLPGSEVTYTLGWRNLDRVELALYRTSLVRDPKLSANDVGSWLQGIPVERLELDRRWTHETGDAGDHEPGYASLTIEGEVATGAYVLEASGGGERSRALVLVSDAGLTVKVTGDELLAWLTDVETGEPVAGADLRLWQSIHQNGRQRLREFRGETGVDGTKLFQLGGSPHGSSYFLAARADDRQAFVSSSAGASLTPSQEWRIYAYTDRPAYRPLDEVQWKVVARRFDGRSYSTPGEEELRLVIRDPRGTVVKELDAELDAFGAASGSLETDATMALGEYQVTFFHRKSGIGSARLFRLEEYELPEFEVSVQVPEDDTGRPKLHAVGDEVEVEIEAAYYFGGPVAQATVEVFVYQKGFAFRWPEDREFPWLYQEVGRHWWGGHGGQVAHQILKTDDEGRVTFTFATPADAGSDFEYTIEARVTDASRREILGQGSVKVTRSEYFVRVQAEHAIHRPGAKVDLEIDAADPNGNPVVAEGEVEVTRERWSEIWRDPTGKRVPREELPRGPGGRVVDGCELVFRGYEKEVVATTQLTTGADGTARWSFTPDRDGTYRVVWTGRDGRDGDIRAETTVFVADESTRELGYLSGEIEILVDQDTLQVGSEATLLLTTPASGRWVLLTVEAETLQLHRVLKLDGTVKLVRLPITEEHVPNVWVAAVTVNGGQAFQAREELIVPPLRQFLSIEVEHDAEVREPGTEGELAVLVRDHTGEPVSAQVSLAVVDDSVSYIQEDMAGDPRRFFHGQRRYARVMTHGTFQHHRFRKLKDGEDADDLNELQDRFGERDYRMDNRPGEKKEGAFAQRARGEGLSSLGYAGKAAASDMALAPASVAFEAEEMAGGRVQQGQAGGAPGVRVRNDFRDTALWAPAVVTGPDGRATVSVKFPDSTTRWRTTARAVDTGTRVGTAEAFTRTRQPLIARLQTPRFFLVGDELTISGNINNNTEEEVVVRPTLWFEGSVEILGRVVEGELSPPTRHDEARVPAGGEARVDWRVRVTEPGEVLVGLRAVTVDDAGLGDAVERRVPVYPHGIEALIATSGKFDTDAIAFGLDIPGARDGDTTELVVQVSPSLAVTMLDALPYVVGYPYGCTEQTLSRFLPSVVVARTLRARGLSAEDAMERVFGGIEAELAGKTHPEGKQALDELDRMVERGLERLYDFQHQDGGWAWWKTGESDHFMTAYVLWGLSLARDSGIEVREGVLASAARWLASEIVEKENQLDLQAWLLHALAVHGAGTGDPKSAQWIDAAFENLWKKRTRLNAYGRALVALSAHELGREREAGILVQNLIDGAEIDDSPDSSIVQVGPQTSRDFVQSTAHWGEDGIYHRWSDGGVEATAFALRALVAIDPDHELIEPATNWLIRNRRGAQWSNTRDTTIAVLALNDYLEASGELASPASFRVLVNGRTVASRELAVADLLSAPSELRVDPEWLVDGENEIRIERTSGDGPLYFAARATFFSREEPIPARGHELFVRREYYKLVGRPTLLAGYVYDRVPLRDGDTITSGERVEVVLTVETKNELEYLLFEDLKPAGFEAVQVRSGDPLLARELRRGGVEERFLDGRVETTARDSVDRALQERAYTGRTRGVHHELRDRKVALFVDRLGDGFWELRYDLRAETPGSFHALPLLGHAMYVPEIRANGEELRIQVLDRTDG
jgi:uncharacterized protein YfaS (alpha-2-macroglobulin family)/tetratricopeptide (TPR) repeat protein